MKTLRAFVSPVGSMVQPRQHGCLAKPPVAAHVLKKAMLAVSDAQSTPSLVIRLFPHHVENIAGHHPALIDVPFDPNMQVVERIVTAVELMQRQPAKAAIAGCTVVDDETSREGADDRDANDKTDESPEEERRDAKADHQGYSGQGIP